MAFARLSDVWKINGQPIYEPKKETQIEYESLSAEGSGRNAQGIMKNKFIRPLITKVSIEYPALTSEQVGEILSMVQGQEYDLTYPDPIYGVRTIHCYSGTSSTTIYSSVIRGGLHTNVKFNCIEV